MVSGKSASGGIDNGKIGDYDKLILGDEEQLIVSTDEKPSEILYLQGFIGTSYANNEWKTARTDAFKSGADRIIPMPQRYAIYHFKSSEREESS